MPERGDGAGLEALTEQVDGLCSVGTMEEVTILDEAAEVVAIEAARPHRSAGCRWSEHVQLALNTTSEQLE